MKLQQEQPALYTSLTTSLSPDEQGVVQQVVHEADRLQGKILTPFPGYLFDY